MPAVLPLVVILLEAALLGLQPPEDGASPLALVLLAWALVRLYRRGECGRRTKP